VKKGDGAEVKRKIVFERFQAVWQSPLPLDPQKSAGQSERIGASLFCAPERRSLLGVAGTAGRLPAEAMAKAGFCFPARRTSYQR